MTQIAKKTTKAPRKGPSTMSQALKIHAKNQLASRIDAKSILLVD